MDTRELTDVVVKIADNYRERYGVEYDTEWFLLKIQEELGELTQAYFDYSGRGRKRSATPEEAKQKLADEIADVYAYVLLLSRELNIDPGKAVEDKWFKYLE